MKGHPANEYKGAAAFLNFVASKEFGQEFANSLNNISPIGFTREADGTLGAFSWWKGADLGTSFRYGRPVPWTH